MFIAAVMLKATRLRVFTVFMAVAHVVSFSVFSLYDLCYLHHL